MKKFLVVLLIFCSIFCVGFKKYKKPYAIITAGSITQENTQRLERFFAIGQRINIGIFAPSGFKYEGIRLQISKQDEKTSNWGFSIIQSRDIYLDKSTDRYTDYIVLNRSGHYILQFFYLNNKDYPFIHREFYVQ